MEGIKEGRKNGNEEVGVKQTWQNDCKLDQKVSEEPHLTDF